MYLNGLLQFLLLLLVMYGEPITITINIARNITKAYYYNYYFPDYYYYFPMTIKLIITVEPKKHNTRLQRLQSNIQIPLLLSWYHTLPQTHYYR